MLCGFKDAVWVQFLLFSVWTHTSVALKNHAREPTTLRPLHCEETTRREHVCAVRLSPSWVPAKYKHQLVWWKCLQMTPGPVTGLLKAVALLQALGSVYLLEASDATEQKAIPAASCHSLWPTEFMSIIKQLSQAIVVVSIFYLLF